MASEWIIRTEGVTRVHGEGRARREVLRDLSLRVARGRRVAVMGPSGSGKSTLLNLLSGLDAPTAGRVEVLGQDLALLSDDARTHLRRQSIGFVFQFFNLVPHMTVADNVCLPLLLSGARSPRDDPRFREAVDAFSLAGLLDRHPHELSGGEMQRISIARAVVHRPPLLLADEPTGNLTSRAGREVMEILCGGATADGRTLLLVTHDPRDASHAEEVIFLRDGTLVDSVDLTHDADREDRIHACLERLSI